MISVALDLGNLGSERIRLRPSGEFGFANGVDTYLMSAEIMFRFTDDSEIAVPYIGLGPGVFGQQGCGEATDCPALWLQFALGFELRLRSTMNWLVEYHAEDAFDKHRVFIGLSTRRGG